MRTIAAYERHAEAIREIISSHPNVFKIKYTLSSTYIFLIDSLSCLLFLHHILAPYRLGPHHY